MVCTSTYATKANIGQGGVGYEKSIITGEIYHKAAKPGKFVPIIRSGNPEQALPSFLLSIFYIDFRSDSEIEQSFETLLRHLLSKPKYSKPPLGKPPSFDIKQDDQESN